MTRYRKAWSRLARALAAVALFLGGCQHAPDFQTFNAERHTPAGCYVMFADDTPMEHGTGKRCEP